MDQGRDALQEYDPTVREPVRIWVFCRECRCRLQVRMVPRPSVTFACLCGFSAPLGEFDVLDSEDRAKEVAETFETAYAATKQALAGMIKFKKTRMFQSSGDFRALINDSNEESAEESPHAPKPFETEREYAARVGELMGALDQAGNDPLARHEALNEVIAYTFQRRKLRNVARAFCVRACTADIEQIETLIRFVRQNDPSARLRFPSFKKLIKIHREAGDRASAMQVALKAQAMGMPGFDDVIADLRRG